MADRKALETLIQSNVPEDGAWFEQPTKLKSKQLKNAADKFASNVSEHSVVALMDTTLLKSGKEGFLLTEHTMYVKMLYKVQVPLDDIREVTYDDADITVTYHNGAINTFYASIYAEDIYRFLQGLATQTAPKTEKTPAPKKEPVKEAAPEKAPAPKKAAAKEAAPKKETAPKVAEPPKAPAPEKQIRYHNRMSCSVEELTQLASEGMEAAMYELGYRYKNGVDAPQSKELAFEWTHKAALAGYEPAFISVAIMYLERGHTKQNELYAEYWLKKAVLQGHYPVEKSLSDVTSSIKTYYNGCNVGDIITFGQYYDDAYSDKLGPIYWRVIAKEGTRLLVVSELIVDYCPFSKESNENGHATWEGSDLRKWLHNEFWSTAFREIDTSYITETVVRTNPSPEYSILADTIPKKENSFTKANVKMQVTRDRVFLLSMEEVVQYFYKGTKPKMNVRYHYDDRYPSFDFSPDFWFNAKGSDQTHAKADLSLYTMNKMLHYPNFGSNVIKRDLEYSLTTLSTDYWLRNTACFNPKHPGLTARKILTVSGGLNYHSQYAKDFKRSFFKRKVPFDAILQGSIDLREYFEPAGVRPAMWLDFSV